MATETLHPMFAEAEPARRNKILTAAEAARLVRDGDTVATGGFIGIGFAENLAVALEKRFLGEDPRSQAGTPRELTLVYAAGQGDGTLTRRLWRHVDKIPQLIGSAVIVGEHVYILNEDGVAQCFELQTGKEVRPNERLSSDLSWGSLVAGAGRLPARHGKLPLYFFKA